jgi:hypothetical protein
MTRRAAERASGRGRPLRGRRQFQSIDGRNPDLRPAESGPEVSRAARLLP